MIVAFAGMLGSYKTCSLTYFALMAHLSGQKVYSNYRLYGIPYYPVHSIEQVASMKDGFAAMDEFWLWADSRVATSKRNRAVARIISASRHVGVDFGFTVQLMHMADRRLRQLTDLTVLPKTLSGDSVKLEFYQGTSRVKLPVYYDPRMIYALYDTTEVVEEPLPGETEPQRVRFPIRENKAWIAFLGNNGIWGKNARRICDGIDAEIRKAEE